MGYIIDTLEKHGFVDWIPRYWPWSLIPVGLFLFCLYGYTALEWWEKRKKKKD